MVMDHIKEQLPEQKLPSTVSIFNWLKKDFKYSYKRVSHRFTHSFTVEEMTIILQFLYIMKRARDEESRIIYIDEFAVLGNEHINYYWGPIG